MRIIKRRLAVIFWVVFFCSFAAGDEPNDITAYYGFDEIEIIKLNWGIQNLRVVDFNGDGRGDIAVVNNQKARIEILLQKEAQTLAEAQVSVVPEDIDINAITTPTRFLKDSVSVSQRITSFVVGDLNSDGMMDLAFYGEPKGLYVILQKSSDAEGEGARTLNWQTRKKIKIADGLLTYNALVCADLNNDGADDLVLAGRDTIYLIMQKDDGSLAEAVKYPVAVLPLITEVTDLDGDGINDLVLVTSDAEKPIHVRFGLPTGQLGPQEQFFIEKPWAMQLLNMDSAPGDEILTVDSRSGRLLCYKFAAVKDNDADWPVLFYPLASGQGDTLRDLVIGDIDGDGLADIVISDPGAAELIFYKQIKGIGLAEPVRFGAFADTDVLSAADIDRDGKCEIASLSVKEKLIGVSKFEEQRLSFPKPVAVVGKPVAMALDDMDCDKKIDCVYISTDANDVRELRIIYELSKRMRNGVGKTPSPKPALSLDKLSSDPDGIRIVDVDQDGLKDILIFVKYEQPLLVRQTKRKEFELVDSPDAQASLIKDAGTHSVAVADVDGKEGEELLIAQKNFARSLVFAKGETWTVLDQYNAKSTENNISAVAAFDIESAGAQGKPAILLLDGQKGQLQILKAGDDNTYRFERALEVGGFGAVGHLKMLFASLTGSDDRSILLFDSSKFVLISPPKAGVVRRHLEQQFIYETKIKDGVYGNITAGDINSDGRPDIIMVEHKRNHIEILALNSERKPEPAMRFKLFEQKSYREKKGGKSSVEPRELMVADVTGDGKDDLVTIIHDRLIIYPQD